MTHTRVGEMSLFQFLLHPFQSHRKAAFAGALAVVCALLMSFSSAQAGPTSDNLRGYTRSDQGAPLPGVQVVIHSVAENTDQKIVSDQQGAYLLENLKPGRYQLTAVKQGMAVSEVTTIDIRAHEDLRVDITMSSLKGAISNLTADSLPLTTTGNVSAAPLTDREMLLLQRLDQLEQRLEAIEARDAKAAALAPTPSQPTPAPSQPKTSETTVAAALPAPVTPVSTGTRSPAAPPKHTLLASLEDAIGLKSAEKAPAISIPPSTQAATPAPATTHVLPVALEAPDPPAPNTQDVTNWADFTWMNGNTRSETTVLDTKFFTPEVRFDTNFIQSFNQPKDHTLGGATESFRSGEFQLDQISVGGNFHWGNVRGRILTMDGLFATTTPRNDASAGVGQWDVRGAYKYVSEAWGGYHFNFLGPRGVNVDAGIFVSYIGLFSYYNFDNWTYQPSYVSSNTPWFFNGLRIQMFPTKKLKIEPWIINGWQSYNRYNSHLGLGGQILYRPEEWLSFVFNSYGYGEDNLGLPTVQRIHTDDSIELRYYNKPKSRYIDKAAFSLTGDLGCQYGPGFRCTGGATKDAFLGWMGYNRIWWGHDHYGLTYGGGVMNNPGRYLTLLPPINGADAVSGSPYFTENPGQRAKMWDTTLTFQWMPNDFITWWAELGYRHSDIPYFTGRQGITPPGGNTGSPQYYVCAAGGSANTSDLPTAEANCGGGIGSVWFPDLRNSQGAASAGVMVKF